jgi:hypothetical protein
VSEVEGKPEAQHLPKDELFSQGGSNNWPHAAMEKAWCGQLHWMLLFVFVFFFLGNGWVLHILMLEYA